MAHPYTTLRRLGAAAAILITVAGPACKDEAAAKREADAAVAAQKREIEAAANAAAEKAVAEERARVAAEETDKAAAIEREKQRVVSDPSSYLEAKDVQVFDEGIIRRYREVVKLSVVNKAKWPVDNIRGEVEWLDAGHNKIAGVTLAIKGSIPSGATLTISKQDGTLTSSTIQSAAPNYRIRFTKVALLESLNSPQ